MAKGQEQRKHVRMRKPLTIKFREIKDEAKSEYSDWGLAAVLNIGAGGALFYQNEPLKVGAILELQFTVDDSPVDCTAKVIREEKIPHMALTAVTFIDIDKRDKTLIEDSAKVFHSEPLND